MENVKDVASNQEITLILLNNGDLFGCGGNSPNYQGELGFGDMNPVFTPKKIMSNVSSIAIGNNCTAIIKDDGTLWMCGINGFLGGK